MKLNKKILALSLACACICLHVNDLSAQYLEWMKQLGGTGTDQATSIAEDRAGNIITVGAFTGTADFDPGISNYNLTSHAVGGGHDIFISKLDASGNFIWAKQLTSTGYRWVKAIVVDNSGCIYLTGNFNGTMDFDPGPGNYFLSSATQYSDIFACKLDSSGNFVWAHHFGSSMHDYGNTIALDPSGYVYVAGKFRDTVDFDPGASTQYLYSFGATDIFLLKLDVSGSFMWAKNMGGSQEDNCLQIKADSSGNVYATGLFQGVADFDPGTMTYNLVSSGQDDAFISKFDSAGNFIWAHRIGGSLSDAGNAITVDYYGNVYIAGTFRDTVDFDPGSSVYTQMAVGSDDIFLLKLDSSGSFVWAGQMGGPTIEVCYSLNFDRYENLILGGTFTSQVDFDPGAGIYNLDAGGHYLGFVCKIHISGVFLWAEQLESVTVTAHQAGLLSLLSNPSGVIYATGLFQGVIDFDPGIGTYNVTPFGGPGGQDIFVLKLNTTPVGINEWLSTPNIVRVYPNPAASQINFHSLKAAIDKIEIYNMLGQTIFEKTYANSPGEIKVDVSTFASGIYLIKVISETSMATLKVIKE